jgi:multicomponent Na+:H+ antiporter subunit E
MKTLTLNAILALLWAALTGRFDLLNIAVGYALGFVIVFLSEPVLGRSPYFRKAALAVRFHGYVVYEVVKSNLRVAYDIVTPTHHMRPGIIAIPLDARTDLEITMFANLITLTPGTLSLDVSADRSVLYVHVMYLHEDLDRTRREIKDSFERRLLELLR